MCYRALPLIPSSSAVNQSRHVCADATEGADISILSDEKSVVKGGSVSGVADIAHQAHLPSAVPHIACEDPKAFPDKWVSRQHIAALLSPSSSSMLCFLQSYPYMTRA